MSSTSLEDEIIVGSPKATSSSAPAAKPDVARANGLPDDDDKDDLLGEHVGDDDDGASASTGAAAGPPQLTEEQRAELVAEQEQLESDIAILHQQLREAEARLQDIRRQLGLTPMAKITSSAAYVKTAEALTAVSERARAGMSRIQQSNAMQKTSEFFRNTEKRIKESWDNLAAKREERRQEQQRVREEQAAAAAAAKSEGGDDDKAGGEGEESSFAQRWRRASVSMRETLNRMRSKSAEPTASGNSDAEPSSEPAAPSAQPPSKE